MSSRATRKIQGVKLPRGLFEAAMQYFKVDEDLVMEKIEEAVLENLRNCVYIEEPDYASLGQPIPNIDERPAVAIQAAMEDFYEIIKDEME